MDSKRRPVDFSHIVIVLTSDLGSAHSQSTIETGTEAAMALGRFAYIDATCHNVWLSSGSDMDRKRKSYGGRKNDWHLFVARSYYSLTNSWNVWFPSTSPWIVKLFLLCCKNKRSMDMYINELRLFIVALMLAMTMLDFYRLWREYKNFTCDERRNDRYVVTSINLFYYMALSSKPVNTRWNVCNICLGFKDWWWRREPETACQTLPVNVFSSRAFESAWRCPDFYSAPWQRVWGPVLVNSNRLSFTLEPVLRQTFGR